MSVPPPPHKDDEMAVVLPTRLADDHGPEWRQTRPRLVGPGGRGPMRGIGGLEAGSPERGIAGVGSVSGLELRRACFFSPSSAPSAPWAFGGFAAPFLRGFHLEQPRELTTSRVVEGLLSPGGQGVLSTCEEALRMTARIIFILFVWRGSALFLPNRGQRAWGLSQARWCCTGILSANSNG